jgi:tetratricopeptide (TPR) repeat protein
MQRPQINLILSLFLLLMISFLSDLAPRITLFFLIALLIFYVLVGKDFFIARYKTKKRKWNEAIASYQKFEIVLEKLHSMNFKLPVFMSMYTYNGFSLVKHNIAHCYINNGNRQEAKRLLLEAISLDKDNALPYVGLAFLAAMEGESETANREYEKARSLGFRNKGFQKIIQKILAGTNQGIGQIIS